MAIPNQLTGIKDYFLDWHKKNYAALHNPISNEVTTQSPKNSQAVTSEAVYTALNNKFDEVTTCTVQQCNTTPAPTGSLQSTLDDFNTRINNVSGSIKTVSTGTLTKIVDNPQSYGDPDTRGFIWPPFDNNAHDGFMTPRDKMDLYYATTWFEKTGSQLGTNTTISNHLQLWVNVGLRLVYCSFEYVNCPWLKNAYNNSTKKEYHGFPYVQQTELFYKIRPKQNIWAPTNIDGLRIGVTKGGDFYIRSDNYIKVDISINGSLMWYYGDDKPSLKVETGGYD